MTRSQLEKVMSPEGETEKNEEREKTEEKQEKDSNGIAIRNVVSRLELYYNRSNLFSIWSDGLGCGTEVTVLLPVESPAAAAGD